MYLSGVAGSIALCYKKGVRLWEQFTGAGADGGVQGRVALPHHRALRPARCAQLHSSLCMFVAACAPVDRHTCSYTRTFSLTLPDAAATTEQWIEALVEWLGITEDRVHCTTTKRDTDLTGRRFECVIASYNFVGDLTDRWLALCKQLHWGHMHQFVLLHCPPCP